MDNWLPFPAVCNLLCRVPSSRSLWDALVDSSVSIKGTGLGRDVSRHSDIVSYSTLAFVSFQGVGTNESALIEILCSRTDTELVAIKNEYQSVYGRTLETDLDGDTNGDFKDILIAILQRPVETNNNVVDVAKIKQVLTHSDKSVRQWGIEMDKATPSLFGYLSRTSACLK